MNASSAVQFGSLLREARRRQGLSQNELGAGKYSGSYISHLESGRRSATPEVIEFLSRRLGVSPLEWGVSPAGDPRQLVAGDTIEDLLVAERAWSEHDWAAAMLHSTQAAATAEAAGDTGRHWEALYVLAMAKFSSGDFAGAATLAEQLAEHETARKFAVARAQALSLASVSFRASDRLGWAVAYGARAVEAASAAPPIILSEALMALVSAMSEAGHTAKESRPYLDRLAELSPAAQLRPLEGPHRLDHGHGGVRGRRCRGRPRAPRAGRRSCSMPGATCACGCGSTAALRACRLDAGIVEGVPELVHTAALGLQILGNQHDVVELRQVEAKLALLTGDPQECARIMSAVLDDPVLGAPDVSRGASELPARRGAAGDGQGVSSSRALHGSRAPVRARRTPEGRCRRLASGHGPGSFKKFLDTDLTEPSQVW